VCISLTFAGDAVKDYGIVTNPVFRLSFWFLFLEIFTVPPNQQVIFLVLTNHVMLRGE
jgi:hypothetical protein